MPWGKHDDKFHRNRKVKPLRHTRQGLAALGLRSVLHSECLDDPELDGRVQTADLRSKRERVLCEVLADAGLMDRDGDDYILHDWDDYNPTKSGLSKARAKTRERVTKHRERTGNAVTPALVTGDETVTLTRTPSRTPSPSRTPPPNGGVTHEVAPRRSRAKGAPAWDAYAGAYEARYGEPPVRNATVNAQMGKFVSRVPEAEAPAIAAHYVSNNGSYYVAQGHPVGALLRDAEKLRTEWATGRRVTSHAARQADKRDGRAQEYQETFARLDAEAGK